MTFSLLKAQALLKARQHKYTHRKLVGRDPKTNRKRYRYYYAEHHGGGITSAEIEAGSAFKLTFKGRRGHFHVQSVEGDVVTVKHDGRPNSKPVEMTKAEFRALLKRQHETVENKKREKAQENRRRGRKKRKGSKRTKRKTATPQTQAPEQTPQVQEPEQGADNFETITRTARDYVTSINTLATIMMQSGDKAQLQEGFSSLRDKREKLDAEISKPLNVEEMTPKEHTQAISQLKVLRDQILRNNLVTSNIRLMNSEELDRQAKTFLSDPARALNSKLEKFEAEAKQEQDNLANRDADVETLRGAYDIDVNTIPSEDLSSELKRVKKMLTLTNTIIDRYPLSRVSFEAERNQHKLNTLEDKIQKRIESNKGNLDPEHLLSLSRGDRFTYKNKEYSIQSKTTSAGGRRTRIVLRALDGGSGFSFIIQGISSKNSTPSVFIEGETQEPEQGADNFETMPEPDPSPAREQLTETAREVTAPEPTASELSDDDLRRELLRARAALDDQGTLIDEARRKRQRISDLRKKEKVLAERVNTLENESQRRTPEPQGRGAKVPSQSELDRAIEQVRALVEQNPALANRPEVAVLLGSPDKQEVVAKGLPDSEMVITLNGKTQNVAVKYKIIEAGDAIPSHDASAFFQRKDYPSDVQEREYHNARSGEQEKVILQAKNLNPLLLVNTNPDAMNGPPILDQNGIALGGNSRVMSVQRAYLAHPEKAQAYKDYLKKKASTFGLSQSDVDGFTSPLLVREYLVEDQGKENLSKIVRAMNEGLTQEFDLLAEGRNNATKLLGENNTLRSLSVALRDAPDDTTLSTMLKKKGERFERVKRALFADGILTKRNASKYLSQATGTMNDVGVAMLKSTLLGYVVRDDRLMRAMSPTTVDTLTNAFGRLAVVGLDRDQAEALQDAVYVYNQVTNKPKDTGGITTKMTPKQRDARVNESMMRDQGFTFKEASGEDVADESINFEKIKDRVKENPLSSAFLKILALNPTSGALNRSMKEFVKLVDEDQGGTDLFGSAAVDFTTAAQQIASKLANKHGARDGLYKSLIGLNLLDLYKALRC